MTRKLANLEEDWYKVCSQDCYLLEQYYDDKPKHNWKGTIARVPIKQIRASLASYANLKLTTFSFIQLIKSDRIQIC